MTEKEKDMVRILKLISADCETDAREFDGKPFNGKTLGELHGILEAKIAAVTDILRKYIEENSNGQN